MMEENDKTQLVDDILHVNKELLKEIELKDDEIARLRQKSCEERAKIETLEKQSVSKMKQFRTFVSQFETGVQATGYTVSAMEQVSFDLQNDGVTKDFTAPSGDEIPDVQPSRIQKFYIENLTNLSIGGEINSDGHHSTVKTPDAVQAPPPSLVGVWDWMDTSGTWQPYTDELNRIIEKAYVTWPKSSKVINMDDKQYRLVFTSMTQVKIDSEDHELRCIRRRTGTDG